MGHKPRIAVLTTAWGDEDDEFQLVLRQLAAALALGTTAPAVVKLGASPSTWIDGAFEVVGVPADRPDERRSRLLQSTLDTSSIDLASALPEQAQRELSLLAGGGVSPGLADKIADLGPSLILLAGYRSAALVEVLRAFSGRCRCVLAPLSGMDPLIALRQFDETFLSADTVLTVTLAEHDKVSRRVRADHEICFTGLSLNVDPLARETEAPGLNVEDYVLVLSKAEKGDAQTPETLCRYLHLQLGGHPVVVIGDDHMLISRGTSYEDRPAPVTRMDLWRVMARARTTVDMSSASLIAREAVESLLLGTPVVVPERGAGREHAERGNGGLWYRNLRELVECLRLVRDPAVASSLGRSGQEYATRYCGDGAAFVERLSAISPEFAH